MQMIKFPLIIIFLTLSLSGAEPLVEMIVKMGNMMKGKYVDDVLYLEEVYGKDNKSISSFIIQAKNPKDKEQTNFVNEMKSDPIFREEVLEDFTAQNREKLCKNLFLERLKAIDLTYVYEFHFVSKDQPLRKTIQARECPAVIQQNSETNTTL